MGPVSHQCSQGPGWGEKQSTSKIKVCWNASTEIPDATEGLKESSIPAGSGACSIENQAASFLYRDHSSGGASWCVLSSSSSVPSALEQSSPTRAGKMQNGWHEWEEIEKNECADLIKAIRQMKWCAYGKNITRSQYENGARSNHLGSRLITEKDKKTVSMIKDKSRQNKTDIDITPLLRTELVCRLSAGIN